MAIFPWQTGDVDTKIPGFTYSVAGLCINETGHLTAGHVASDGLAVDILYGKVARRALYVLVTSISLVLAINPDRPHYSSQLKHNVFRAVLVTRLKA